MVATSLGSAVGDPWSTGVASEEAVGMTYSVNEVLSRFGGLSGVPGDSGRFRGMPFGLLLRNASHSGLMGASSAIMGISGRVGGSLVHVASVVPSVMCTRSSMMRSGCASVMSMSGGPSLYVSVSSGAGMMVGNAD